MQSKYFIKNLQYTTACITHLLLHQSHVRGQDLAVALPAVAAAIAVLPLLQLLLVFILHGLHLALQMLHDVPGSLQLLLRLGVAVGQLGRLAPPLWPSHWWQTIAVTVTVTVIVDANAGLVDIAAAQGCEAFLVGVPGKRKQAELFIFAQ